MLLLAPPGPCLPLPVVVVTGPPGEEPAKYLGEPPPPPAKYLLQVSHLHNTTRQQTVRMLRFLWDPLSGGGGQLLLLPNYRFAKLPSPAIDWKIWKALYSGSCLFVVCCLSQRWSQCWL